MDYAITSVVNTFFTIFILFFLLTVRKYAKFFNFTLSSILGVVLFFSFYKVIIYLLLPIFFDLVNNYHYFDLYDISPLSSMYLYAIETVSWFCWMCGFLFIGFYFRGKNISHNIEFKTYPESFIKIMLTFITLVFSYFRIDSLTKILTLENESSPIFLEVFKSLVNYIGHPTSIILLIYSFKWNSIYLRLFGAIGLIISIVSSSTRGSLIYAILFLIIVLYYAYGNKAVKISALIIPSLFILYLFTGGLPSAQLEFDDNGEVSLNMLLDDTKKGSRTAYQDIDFRFGALSRFSTKFIDMYQRGFSAGFNPIINSAKGFLPRSIYPEKPHPSTLNGNDIFSQGMYLIHREIFGYDTYTMVEFATGAHAYWELGWIGVVLFSLISGAYIATCSYYFQKFGILSLALIVGVMKPWGYMSTKMWVSDIILQIYQIIIPLFVLSIIFLSLNKLTKALFKIP